MSQQKIVLGRDFGRAVVSYLGLDGAKVAADIKMVVDMDEVFRVSIDCLLDADDLRGIADRMSAIENGKDAIPPSFEPDGLPGFWQEFSRKAIKEIGEIGAAVKQMAEQIDVLTANGTATFDVPAPEQQEEQEASQPEQPEALPLPDLQEVMRNPEKYIGREDCQLLVAEAARTSKRVRHALGDRYRIPGATVMQDGCIWVSAKDMTDAQIGQPYEHRIAPDDTHQYRVPVESLTFEQEGKYGVKP